MDKNPARKLKAEAEQGLASPSTVPTAFNVFRLKRQSLISRPSYSGLVPYVDGVSLLDIVSAYELDKGYLSRHGKKIEGPVNGPLAEAGQPQLRYFLGEMELGEFDEWELKRPASSACARADRTATIHVLGCCCGHDLCWPLRATVTVTAKSVSWSNFIQARRQEGDYSGLGPFVFARAAYEAAAEEFCRTYPNKSG